MKYFRDFCRKNHIVSDVEKVFAYLSEFPENKGYEPIPKQMIPYTLASRQYVRIPSMFSRVSLI